MGGSGKGESIENLAVRLRMSLYAGVLELWPQIAPPCLAWHSLFPLKPGPAVG